jgi:PEP-CTERM motif
MANQLHLHDIVVPAIEQIRRSFTPWLGVWFADTKVRSPHLLREEDIAIADAMKKGMKMKKSAILSVMILGLSGALAAAPAFAGDITGDTVTWQYYAFDSGYGPANFTVPTSNGGNFDNYFQIEAGANSITFDYSVDTNGSGVWTPYGIALEPTIDNGIDLLFSGPSDITSVSVDPNPDDTNMVGFDMSHVSFTPTEIQVNWAGLAFSRSTVVTLDIDGNGSSTATPEPSSFLLLGSGLAGLAGLLKRKFRA